MTETESSSPLAKLREKLRLSPAAWAAIAMGLMLLGIMLAAWVWYSLDPSRVAWGSYMSWAQAVVLLLLWGGACVLTYWSVRFWMQQPPVGDRQLRRAWEGGRTWLSSHSTGLTAQPVYLVLGCWSRHMQSQLFSGGEHAPESAGGEESAFDWHLNDDGIFLVLRHAGVYNELLQKFRRCGGTEAAGAAVETTADPVLGGSHASISEPGADREPDADPQREQSDAGSSAEAQSSASDETVGERAADERAADERAAGERAAGERAAGERAAGERAESAAAALEPSATSDQAAASEEIEVPSDAEAPRDSERVPAGDLAAAGDAGAASHQRRGEVAGAVSATLAPDVRAVSGTPAEAPAFQTLDRVESLVAEAATAEETATDAEAYRVQLGERVGLTSRERAAAQDRLAALCTLLKGARYPAAGINGTLVVVDPDRIADEGTARSLGRAIRNDLEQVADALGVVSPTTTLVAGFQRDDDFRELARRWGQLPPNHLGQLFDAEQIPSPTAVCHLVDNALRETCRRVETVLGRADSLGQPNNHRLVRLAIRCRSWRRRLQWLLVEATAALQSPANAGTGSAASEKIVSGLFLSGAGGRNGLGEWQRGAFRRMSDEQHHLCWTAETRSGHRHQRIAMRGLLAAIALLIALAMLQIFW